MVVNGSQSVQRAGRQADMSLWNFRLAEIDPDQFSIWMIGHFFAETTNGWDGRAGAAFHDDQGRRSQSLKPHLHLSFLLGSPLTVPLPIVKHEDVGPSHGAAAGT